MLNYNVIIIQDGQKAVLKCKDLSEAMLVKTSFENYGKCQLIMISEDETEEA